MVRRYGGTVDKVTGHRIIAVLGAPIALEDHAGRACLAALGVQEEARRLASTSTHARVWIRLAGRPQFRSGDHG